MNDVEVIRGSLSDEGEAMARELCQMLADLQAAYRREAEPILKRLADLEARRSSHYIIRGDYAGAVRGLQEPAPPPLIE